MYRETGSVWTYHVSDIVKTGNPLNIFVDDACSTEDGRGVDGHASDADPLLHYLKPNDKLNTTTSVEAARADTEKHGKVRLRLGRFPLKFGDVTDVLEFGFGLAKVLASLPTQATKNVTCFILAAHLHEPTWRLREDPNHCQEEDEWQDLECNWESPDEGTVTTCVVLASTLDGRELSCTKKGVINELTIRANMQQLHRKYLV